MDRRDVLMIAAASVVGPVNPVAARLHPTIVVDGKTYPVTHKFEREVLAPYPDLVAMDFDEVKAKCDAILQISTARGRHLLHRPNERMAPGGTLTAKEEARLAALNHVFNVHSSIRWLEGRPISDFGFDGVDQVHGNSCRHACGCVTQHAFDHHKAVAGQAHEHHAHYPRYVCDKHQHLAADFRLHRETVLAESA